MKIKTYKIADTRIAEIASDGVSLGSGFCYYQICADNKVENNTKIENNTTIFFMFKDFLVYKFKSNE